VLNREENEDAVGPAQEEEEEEKEEDDDTDDTEEAGDVGGQTTETSEKTGRMEANFMMDSDDESSISTEQSKAMLFSP
jgi:hypothetical protein